jgi:hypothetical protein
VLPRAEPLSAGVTVETGVLQIDLPPIDLDMEPRITLRAWGRPVTAREATYQTLRHALQGCAPERRQGAKAQLRRVFGATRPNPEGLPMSAADVRRLVSDGVSLGAHGCTHLARDWVRLSARRSRRRDHRDGAAGRLPMGVFHVRSFY